jgi:hypothetical protein
MLAKLAWDTAEVERRSGIDHRAEETSDANTCFQRLGRLGQFVHQPSVPNRRLAAFWTFDAMTVRIADLTAGYSASTTSRSISSEMTSITAS